MTLPSANENCYADGGRSLLLESSDRVYCAIAKLNKTSKKKMVRKIKSRNHRELRHPPLYAIADGDGNKIGNMFEKMSEAIIRSHLLFEMEGIPNVIVKIECPCCAKGGKKC
jgi:hypothetical protein